MITLLYSSRSLVALGSPEMASIGVESYRNNRRRAITGALAADGDSFVQLLEGAEDDVDALFERIRLDPRHRDVRLLLREPLAARRLPGWSMKVFDAGRYAHLGRLFRHDHLLAAPARVHRCVVGLMARL